MNVGRYGIYAVLLVLLATFPLYAEAYPLSLAVTILIYMTLAVTWDMLLRSGQLSFGISGLFGVGGYATVLVFLNGGLHPLLSILFGGVVAGVCAGLIGSAVLRLRGMYFAIVTLALAEIFRVVIRNLPKLTGGPEGMVLPSAIFLGDSARCYWLALTLGAAAVGVSEVFQRSRVHFALTAMRNDEVLARSSGIDVYKYLVFVFVVTSAIQGLVGGAYAQIYAFVSPEGSFSLNFTLLPMAMALFGGMHTTWGSVVGAVILGILSEFLKLQIPYGHLLVYGVIIVFAILFFPKGIVGTIGPRIRARG